MSSEELTSEEVNHLEGACAVDDDLTVADEGEIVAAFAAKVGVVGHEHQAEARGVVVVPSVKGVAYSCQSADTARIFSSICAAHASEPGRW